VEDSRRTKIGCRNEDLYPYAGLAITLPHSFVVEKNISIPLSLNVVNSYQTYMTEMVPESFGVEVIIKCLEQVGKDGDGHYKVVMSGVSVGRVQRTFDNYLIDHTRYIIPSHDAMKFVIGKRGCNVEGLRSVDGVFYVRLVINDSGDPAAWVSIIGTKQAISICTDLLDTHMYYYS
jgi:hypothetical protein